MLHGGFLFLNLREYNINGKKKEKNLIQIKKIIWKELEYIILKRNKENNKKLDYQLLIVLNVHFFLQKLEKFQILKSFKKISEMILTEKELFFKKLLNNLKKFQKNLYLEKQKNYQKGNILIEKML